MITLKTTINKWVLLEFILKQQHSFKSEAMRAKMGEEKSKRTKGGLVTMPFIFGNEIAEKLAVVGFSANMTNYLTNQLHMPITKAANTLTNFGGTASLTPLIGAFLADAYVGKFWTIAGASIIYQLGMILLTLSAILPSLRPPSCKHNPQACIEANSTQLAVLYIALFLTSLGSGGIRPCVVAFGADQFDESDPKQKTKTWNFFNWYYFAMGVSILVAVTVLVYIQDTVGWGWGLGIPTIAMFLSIIAFVVGYPLYRNLDPSGSPFTRLVQVSVAAFKKRKLPMVTDAKLLYENEHIDAPFSSGGKLLHTKQFKFLDKAAIVTEQDGVKSAQAPNLWRLNTVHRVEELKCMIRMGPIWAAGILLITAYAQQGTFSFQQAKIMNRHLTNSFEIPPGSMTVFTIVSMLTTITLYDRLFIPFTRKFTGLDRGITFLHRMGIGFVISLLATFVAGFIEIKRKNAALNGHILSAFWLVPQYGLHGIAEAFMSIGHLEFFYDQAPESMRSTATALFWTAISVGNYTSTLLVTLVHKYTKGKNGSDWLPDRDLNKGKLEYFYWLITGLQFVNLIYYICCAKMYTLKPLHIQIKEDSNKRKEDGIEITSMAV